MDCDPYRGFAVYIPLKSSIAPSNVASTAHRSGNVDESRSRVVVPNRIRDVPDSAKTTSI